MKLSSDVKKFVQQKKKEEFLADAIPILMQTDNIYLISKHEEEKHGATWAIWDDSSLFPAGHIIHLSTHNLYVLCHELAHIKDFFRKKDDAHDKIFYQYWEELCFKSYEILSEKRKIK